MIAAGMIVVGLALTGVVILLLKQQGLCIDLNKNKIKVMV